MLYQTDSRLLDEIQQNGCLFMSIVLAREELDNFPWTPEEINEAWLRAKSLKIINPDSLLLQDYPGICEEFKLPIEWFPQEELGLERNREGWIRPTRLSLNKTFWPIERWQWRIYHFVKNDGTGKKPVDYDPIERGSLTVRNGWVVDLRVFRVKQDRLARQEKMKLEGLYSENYIEASTNI